MRDYWKNSSAPMLGMILVAMFLLMRAWLMATVEEDYSIELETKKAIETRAASDRWKPKSEDTVAQFAELNHVGP